MFDNINAPQVAHIARLAAALDAVRAWADAEFDAAPEATEVRFVAARDGAYVADVVVQVVASGGVTLAEVSL